MNRRGFLSLAATTPLVVGPSLVVAPALVAASTAPSDLDMRRYYYFTWSEHHRLALPLGVDPFDAYMVDQAPKIRYAVRDALDQISPRNRAERVLTAAGL